jgi:rsbT co-antagonist protein RsbR
VARPAALSDLLARSQSEILDEWLRVQAAAGGRAASLLGEGERRDQSRELLGLMTQALQQGDASGEGQAWTGVRELLSGISRSRATQGFTPTETATFVFSLKQPLFTRLRSALANDANALADATWAATQLLDRLGLFTTEVHQKSRDAIIQRQQQDMLELSTPVVKLWDGVLALPIIGTLDSARTQVVMETLLQRIVDTGAEVAIIDITGVPTVDTLVAQHLIKTVTAARLMGADCIISGIRPQIAQTIVHLGVDLHDITTKATLADAFKIALERTGQAIRRVGSGGANGANGAGGATGAHGLPGSGGRSSARG